MNGVIRVLWNCDMGEACTNKERPGTHEEHRDMEMCRGIREDEPPKRNPTLVKLNDGKR